MAREYYVIEVVMVSNIRSKFVLFFIPLLFSYVSVALANDSEKVNSPVWHEQLKRQMILSVGINTWGIADPHKNSSGIIDIQLAPVEGLYDIRPTLNINIGDGSEGYYSIGGTRFFDVNQVWSMGLGFQIGYLKDVVSLGYDLEFYSRFILAYHFDVKNAVRLEVGHISNAGFGDVNPGSENLGLSYSYYF